MELVVRKLTEEAFDKLKLHLEGRSSLELTTVQWNTLCLAAESIGYKLSFHLDKLHQLEVSATRIGARLVPLDLAFCHLCGSPSEQVFCDKHWCQRCLTAFVKEAL